MAVGKVDIGGCLVKEALATRGKPRALYPRIESINSVVLRNDSCPASLDRAGPRCAAQRKPIISNSPIQPPVVVSTGLSASYCAAIRYRDTAPSNYR